MSALAGVLGLRDADHVVREMLLDDITRPGHLPATFATHPIASGALAHATTWVPKTGARPSTLTYDDVTKCVIACDCRIDNRDELVALLGTPRSVSDSDLVAAAYLRWGPEFASRLLGAFAIALWDPRSAMLLLIRDQIGVRPLAYTSGGGAIVFGSSVNAIRQASPGAHPVYTDKLLHMVVDPLEAGEPDRTVFTDISYVPPASIVTLRLGEQAQITRYWQLTAPPKLVLSSNREYEEAFRHELAQAVRCRIDSDRPVASMLSGGLDSSAITALACEQVDGPLRTYSAIESRPNAVSDTPAINAVIKRLDLDPVCLDEKELARRFDIRRLLEDPAAIFDDSMVTLWGAAEHASTSGHTVLLTGVGGDEALVASQFAAALDQHHQGDRRAAWAELRESDSEAVSLKDSLRMLAGGLQPQSLRRLRQQRPRPFDRSDPVSDAGVDPTSAAAPQLRVLLDRLDADPEWNTPNDQLNRLRKPFNRVALERYDRVAARHGVEVRHPILDRRVLDFALSLPQSQLRYQGWTKSILRRAFVNDLPDEVTWRPKEIGVLTPFISEVISEELAAHQPSLANDTGQPFDSFLPPGSDKTDRWVRLVLQIWVARHGN